MPFVRVLAMPLLLVSCSSLLVARLLPFIVLSFSSALLRCHSLLVLVSGTYNYFDPDNFISTSAMLHSGDPYLQQQVKRVLLRYGRQRGDSRTGVTSNTGLSTLLNLVPSHPGTLTVSHAPLLSPTCACMPCSLAVTHMHTYAVLPFCHPHAHACRAPLLSPIFSCRFVSLLCLFTFLCCPCCFLTRICIFFCLGP